MLGGLGLAVDAEGRHIAVDLGTTKRLSVDAPVRFVDPKMPLLLAGGEPSQPVLVYDRRNGEIVYELSATEVAARELVVKSLYGGEIYITEGAQRKPSVIDVRAGERCGSWKTYPVAVVGEYRWMSDGTLTRKKTRRR